MTAGSRLFTQERRKPLTSVLDCIIPTQGHLPGAGAVGLVPSSKMWWALTHSYGGSSMMD